MFTKFLLVLLSSAAAADSCRHLNCKGSPSPPPPPPRSRYEEYFFRYFIPTKGTLPAVSCWISSRRLYLQPYSAHCNPPPMN
jgi:hypothetical protein